MTALYIGTPQDGWDPIPEPGYIHRDSDGNCRSHFWMEGFADSFRSRGLLFDSSGWNEERNGNSEYGDGFNAGTDLAMFLNDEHDVLDLREILL